MEAASAASTFDFSKISTISSGFPHPPDAITGIDALSTMDFVNKISYPFLVPSASILVSKISPAPNFSAFFAHVITSTPVPCLPPKIIS